MSEEDLSDETPQSLEPEIQARLGSKLKEVYSDVINEPVPDRFLQLLDELEKSEDKKSSS